MYETTFSPSRAIEALIFIAKHLGNPTIHEVLKIQYFADKLHFSKFGFIASGDKYVAMKFGPVASNTYNVIKAARGERGSWIHPALVQLVDGAIEVKDGSKLVPIRDPDLDQMSSADVDCLAEAIKLYGDMPFRQRTELSHDAAWEKAWAAACDDNVFAGDMSVKDIALTLPNADEVIEHLNT